MLLENPSQQALQEYTFEYDERLHAKLNEAAKLRYHNRKKRKTSQ